MSATRLYVTGGTPTTQPSGGGTTTALPTGNILTADDTTAGTAPATVRPSYFFSSFKSYQVTLAPGAPTSIQTFTGSRLPNSTTGAYADSYLYLVDSTGHIVASDDESGAAHGGGTGSSYLTYTAPAVGSYTVYVTTYSGSSAMPFHVIVNGPTPSQGGGGTTTGVPNVRAILPLGDASCPRTEVAALNLNRGLSGGDVVISASRSWQSAV